MSKEQIFFREITQLSSNDCFVVFDRHKTNWDWPVHFHPEYEINFIKNSSGVKRIVGESVEIIEGQYDLVFVGSNLEHGWINAENKNEDAHEVTIQFSNELYNDALLSKTIMEPIKTMFERSKHGILFSNQTAKQLEAKFTQLAKKNGIDVYLEMTSLLYDLAISRNQRLLSFNSVTPDEFEYNEKLKKVYDYVQENFHRKITLSEVAELVNMSNVSFNRYMKSRTARTFVDYVNEVRISNAAKLLIQKEKSISEIAFESGFYNISNFNRVFKKIKNCSPSKYRNEYSGMNTLEIKGVRNGIKRNL